MKSKKMQCIVVCLCALFSSYYAHSQTKPVSGTVTNEKNETIANVSVVIKGSSLGTTTNNAGKYTINAKVGDVLEFTSIGYLSGSLTVNTSGVGDIVLKPDLSDVELDVVTALGIKRSRNTLPFAVQQVSGEQVSKIRIANAATALSGKIAGLQIQQGNSIGGSTNVVIRGYKSLLGNNQALFIVDGVPIDNSNTNTRNQTTGRGGYDYGNAAADINPDDIESISVLKSAAATALYGSRASNGVVMITTKKAKKGLSVTLNSGITIGKIDRTTFAEYQNEYGAGYSSAYQKDGFLYFDVDGDGEKDLVVNTGEDASYGRKFDPTLMVYHWDAFDPSSPNYHKKKPWVAAAHTPADFYETAITSNNSIFATGSSDKGFFKLGYTRNDEKGVLPNSRVLRNVFNSSGTYNVNEKFTLGAAANFSKVDGKGRYGTGYSGLNVNQNFRQWYQTNVDILEQKEAYFRNRRNITWNWRDPSNSKGLVPKYTDNYYWTRYENYETDTRSRFFGNASGSYKALPWLDVIGQVSLDTYNELQEERVAVGSKAPGSYIRRNRNFQEINYDLRGDFDKNLTPHINLKGVLGTNIRRTTVRSVSLATNGGLIVPGLYTIANSVGTPGLPVEQHQPVGVDGYFTGATLTYKKLLTLDGTFRRDIISTLPKGKNGYNYYGISGGFLFGNLLKSVSWFSYGKLRANYATIGTGAEFGRLLNVYDQHIPFGSSFLFSLPGIRNNKDLEPEFSKSGEAGLEVALFKNRVGFELTYYNTKTYNQLMPLDISTATGYNSIYVNAATIVNKGLELSMNGTPVKTEDFSWNVTLNWARNRNKVTRLYQDVKNLVMSTFQGGISVNATLGQPVGTIQGKTYLMIDPKNSSKMIPWDGKSARVVNEKGLYEITTTTNNIIGNINPDWFGGIYNSFQYKNINLGFLIDVRKGGDIWSLDLYYGTNYTGIYPESAGLNELGKPKRDPAEKGGGVILPGVNPNGSANTKRVTLNANTNAYPAAAFLYDASYVKLREVVLSYTFPSKWFTNSTFIKDMTLSFLGRNLWIIHKNLPYSDPEENLSSGNIQGVQSGAYPTTRSMGANLKVNF